MKIPEFRSFLFYSCRAVLGLVFMDIMEVKCSKNLETMVKVYHSWKITKKMATKGKIITCKNIGDQKIGELKWEKSAVKSQTQWKSQVKWLIIRKFKEIK